MNNEQFKKIKELLWGIWIQLFFIYLVALVIATQQCSGQTILKDVPIVAGTKSYNIYMHYKDDDGKTKWLHEAKFDFKNKSGAIVQGSPLSIWKYERVVNLAAYGGETVELLFIANDGSDCADSTYVVVHGRNDKFIVEGEKAVRDENVERDNEINLVNDKKVFIFGEPYENSEIYEDVFYGSKE